MKSTNINLEPLYAAIKEHNLMKVWQEGLFINTEAEGEARAQKIASEAVEKYIIMMRSKKNKRTVEYQRWAVSKALGL
ncbi:hypothetical protein [Aliidiomarina quisquiliarum]|uniref:hypothetical protein n=1 Tax=Aliidiomarina quisquiliarum TaxID=2938947 RepID=UPI00208FC6EC|nr:hypothetical protein [Aliidiomarina quisquiliarum]MCO4320709.1 hypothetical protein [Aliidiomarina quisquiliarum]